MWKRVLSFLVKTVIRRRWTPNSSFQCQARLNYYSMGRIIHQGTGLTILVCWLAFSVAKPEQITSDGSDSSLGRSMTYRRGNDLEIIHTYTIHNKGPSDAKRTEVKLLWPMLPLAGFSEQPPLLYGVDIPSVIRVSDPKATNDRCHIYQSVRRDSFRSSKTLTSV